MASYTTYRVEILHGSEQSQEIYNGRSLDDARSAIGASGTYRLSTYTIEAADGPLRMKSALHVDGRIISTDDDVLSMGDYRALEKLVNEHGN